MKFDSKEVNVLKNFATINPSMTVSNKQFAVKKTGNSMVAKFKLENKHTFNDFGIYEMNEFLSILGTFKDPDIVVNDKFLSIEEKDKSSKIKYFTTDKSLIEAVPNIEEKANKVEFPLVFNLSSDKLSAVIKTSALIRADYVFFESNGKSVKMTTANALDNSNNLFEIFITAGITKNALPKPVKMPIADFSKLISGDYTVKIAEKISIWESALGPVYYIGTAAV